MATRGGPDTVPTGPPLWRRWYVIAAALFLAMLAVLGIWYINLPKKLDVWHPATVPYSADCGKDCKTWRRVALSHEGSSGAPSGKVPTLVYNPKVDDAIAQWADCLQSVLTCVDGTKRGDARGLNACVEHAACPAACKDRFRSETGETMDEAQKALFHVFVDRDAICRPEKPE